MIYIFTFHYHYLLLHFLYYIVFILFLHIITNLYYVPSPIIMTYY